MAWYLNASAGLSRTRLVGLSATLLGSGCLGGNFTNEATATDGSGGPTDGSVASTGAPSTGASAGSSGNVDPLASVCNMTPLRVATLNSQSLGMPGSDQYAALLASIVRVDADVMCLQEVGDPDDFDSGADERQAFIQLAQDAQYDFYNQASDSPAIGGRFTNGCMSRHSFQVVGSMTGRDLSPDSNAQDVGRDILVLRVNPEPGCYAGIFTVHLKSGGSDEDIFRRQVEVERLRIAVSRYRALRPDDAVVALGDFNEQIDDPALGTTITELPATLPMSYRLGSDIELPLIYRPFISMMQDGFSIVPATWEDSTNTDTWGDSSRIDYVMVSGADVVGSEVYNACQDNGVDDAPVGGWLTKAGSALSCGTSDAASDHLPVFADLQL